MGDGTGPLSKICLAYPTMLKLGIVRPYITEIQKVYEWRDTPLEFCWHQHFLTGNQQIFLYQEIEIYIAFWHIFENFFESLRIVLMNMVTILMTSAKMATLDLLLLSRDPKNIIDGVKWLEFGNSNLSMREVIITSMI